MSDRVSRRRFLGTVAATGAGAAAAATAKAAPVRPPGRHGQERVQKIATHCEMCFWRCGVLAEVAADGRVVRLEGNPDHPLTQGRLCARGNAGTSLLYDPDRLKYPMLRTGKRGEGQFKRISWDEALDVLADKLKRSRSSTAPRRWRFFPHGIGSRFFGTLHEGLRHAEQRRAVVRAVPRPARRRLRAHLRPRRSARPSRSTSRRRSSSSSSAATSARTSSPRRSPQFATGLSRGAKLDRRRPALLHRRRARRTGGSRSGPAPTSRCSSPG